MADKSTMFAVVGGEERRREYRKGNWTLNETMVLIEAKKVDNERRMKKSIESEGREGGSSSSSTRPSEMRWKWVEDYCWRYGCYRSQNQCNDRWDNLMRDFKKVRAYEMSLGVEEGDRLSYWKLERHERKERNLPSNLLPEIYEALIEAVDRRGVEVVSGSTSNMAELVGEERHMESISASMPPVMPGPTSQLAPPPPPLSPTHALPQAQAAGTIDSDDDEHSNSPERKRRRGEGSSSKNSSHKLSSAISKSASILAEAFQASEDKEERRHKDLMRIEERKAKIEQSKAEISIQSMEGLATAINQLASSIFGSLADKGPAAPK